MQLYNHFQTITQPSGLTRLVNPSERMSEVVFAGFEAAFAEIKVVTAPTLEPGSVNGEHLTTITPADKNNKTEKGIKSCTDWEEMCLIWDMSEYRTPG